MSGKLLVVATPLGHLEDLSPRGVTALREADQIACEDTRQTEKLRRRFAIDTPTFSHHRFNERRSIEGVLDRLRGGETIALVSDAGTPAISDPGSLLVAAAWEAGVAVEPIPGPSAVITLLSVSGFPADRFVYEGFLPHRAGERRRRIREWVGETRTTVFLESPHRIMDTLSDVHAILGGRPLTLGRELTKVHESIYRGSANELAAGLPQPVKGEITVCLAGASGARSEGDLDAERVGARYREAFATHDGDSRAALRATARALGIRKPQLFRLLAELRIDPESP